MKKALLYAMAKEAKPIISLCRQLAPVAGVPFFSLSDDIIICIGGVGKVNTAMATQLLCSLYAPGLIINAGVAGSLYDAPVGEIILASACVQHDVDTTLAGDAEGLVSTVNLREFPCSRVSDGIKALKAGGIAASSGIVATGDWFGRDYGRAEHIRDEFGAVALEMEACAAAQVCLRNGVDFMAVKSISDHCFAAAQDEEYGTNIKTAVDRLTSAVEVLSALD